MLVIGHLKYSEVLKLRVLKFHLKYQENTIILWYDERDEVIQ